MQLHIFSLKTLVLQNLHYYFFGGNEAVNHQGISYILVGKVILVGNTTSFSYKKVFHKMTNQNSSDTFLRWWFQIFINFHPDPMGNLDDPIWLITAHISFKGGLWSGSFPPTMASLEIAWDKEISPRGKQKHITLRGSHAKSPKELTSDGYALVIPKAHLGSRWYCWWFFVESWLNSAVEGFW